MNRVTLDMLMIFFTSDEFLNSIDLDNMFVILKLYLRHLAKMSQDTGNESKQEIIRMILTNKIEDPKRLELVQQADASSALRQILFAQVAESE
jgi:hypothetical protein